MERKVAFPGDDYIDQIRKICAKLGKPVEADLGFVTSDKARRFILDLPETPGLPGPDGAPIGPAFKASFPGTTDDGALDLLRGMLVFAPDKRSTVEAALEHPFMSSLHMESDEPKAPFDLLHSFEKSELDRDALKRLAWQEMLHYNPKLRPPPAPAAAPPAPSLPPVVLVQTPAGPQPCVVVPGGVVPVSGMTPQQIQLLQMQAAQQIALAQQQQQAAAPAAAAPPPGCVFVPPGQAPPPGMVFLPPGAAPPRPFAPAAQPVAQHQQ